jgi:hypothetical protein
VHNLRWLFTARKADPRCAVRIRILDQRSRRGLRRRSYTALLQSSMTQFLLDGKTPKRPPPSRAIHPSSRSRPLCLLGGGGRRDGLRCAIMRGSRRARRGGVASRSNRGDACRARAADTTPPLPFPRWDSGSTAAHRPAGAVANHFCRIVWVLLCGDGARPVRYTRARTGPPGENIREARGGISRGSARVGAGR